MAQQRKESEEPRERVAKWIEEGRHLLSVIPGLPEENERLKAQAEAAEHECEGLRRAIGELQGENEYFRSERQEIAEAFGRFMNEMLALMNHMVERLRATQRKDTSDRDGRMASASR